MNISIVLAHPDTNSFNHAIARTVASSLSQVGHSVILHDLYAERFDPCLTADEIAVHHGSDPLVELHCRQLRQADGLVLVHPVWFAHAPALMKGWVDRVVRQGVAFRRQADGTVEPLLKLSTALVINTANTRSGSELCDPLSLFWQGTVLAPCGVANFTQKLLAPVVSSTPERRSMWLMEIRSLVTSLFPAVAPRAATVEDAGNQPTGRILN